MTSPENPEVSIVVVTYNSADFLHNCLRSLCQPQSLTQEIIVVDNASQDESCQVVEEVCPTARLLRLPENLGYGAACNAGATTARGHYLVFLNPDTVVESGWLEPMVSVLAADPTVGAVSPMIVLMSDPLTINTCGNDVQFLGFPSCHLLGVKASQVRQPSEVTSISGAAFAIERKVFERLGGFDPDFFMYLEDTDLSWRLRLAGYRCLYVPQSVVRHHYEPRFSAEKFFYIERNRHQLLLKNLHSETLLVFLPALLLAEASIWGYTTLRGPSHIQAKLRATMQTFHHLQKLRHGYALAAKLHRASDANLLRACSAHIAYDIAYEGWLARLTGTFLDPIYAILRWCAIVLLRPSHRDSTNHIPA